MVLTWVEHLLFDEMSFGKVSLCERFFGALANVKMLLNKQWLVKCLLATCRLPKRHSVDVFFHVLKLAFVWLHAKIHFSLVWTLLLWAAAVKRVTFNETFQRKREKRSLLIFSHVCWTRGLCCKTLYGCNFNFSSYRAIHYHPSLIFAWKDVFVLN
jgi:hypothetical protein